MFLIPDLEFSVFVDITYDNLKYTTLLVLNRNAIFKAISNGHNMLSVTLDLLEKCKQLKSVSDFSNYRLRILHKNEEMFMYGECPIKSYRSNLLLDATRDVLDAKRKIETLTAKELEVLLFVYNGYDSERLKANLKMKINTYRVHKRHIFEKMEIHSIRELSIWCEKYLNKLGIEAVNKKETA